MLLLGGGGFLRHRIDLWQLQNSSELLYVCAGNDIYLTDRRGIAWRKLPMQGHTLDVSPNGRRLCYQRADTTESRKRLG